MYPRFSFVIALTVINNLRVTDCKYREWLARFEKSKTLKLCLKKSFTELLSKILFLFSKKKLAKNENTPSCLIKYAYNISEIDKVLCIRIQSIYKTRTQDKLSMRVLPFFYLTIGSFYFF